jgi:hypothetical protein
MNKTTENGWELWAVSDGIDTWYIAVPAADMLDEDAVVAEWEEECEDDEVDTIALTAEQVDDIDLHLTGMDLIGRQLLARLRPAPIGTAHIVASTRGE